MNQVGSPEQLHADFPNYRADHDDGNFGGAIEFVKESLSIRYALPLGLMT